MTRTPRLRIAAALASLPLATVIGLAAPAPAPALAASTYHPCPVNAFCLWRDIYRGGPVAYWRGSTIGNGVRIAPSFAAKASSLWNRSPYTVRVYANPDCTGSPLTYEDFAPGAYVMRLSRYGLNDAARSLDLPDVYVGRC